MSMTPVGLYALEVPPLGVMVPAMQEDSMPDACVSIVLRAEKLS
jgi:FK506-binding nuclear protein